MRSLALLVLMLAGCPKGTTPAVSETPVEAAAAEGAQPDLDVTADAPESEPEAAETDKEAEQPPGSGAETLATPATLEQLKAGWIPGVAVGFRSQKGDVVTYEHWKVISATDSDVTVAYARADFHGNPVEPPREETTPYAELDAHARFPASLSTRERYTETHPDLGELSGWLYTVQGGGEDPEGMVKRLWFNDAWPGPPVRHTVEINGLLGFELAMIMRSVEP